MHVINHSCTFTDQASCDIETTFHLGYESAIYMREKLIREHTEIIRK